MNFKKKMINKFLVVIIILSAFALCIGLLSYVYENNWLDQLLFFGILGFLYSGSFFLVKNGSFRHAFYSLYALLSLTIVIVGVLFRSTGWPYCDLVIAIGIFSLLALYTYHFLKKSPKKEIDWMKLLFLYVYFISRYLSAFKNIIDHSFKEATLFISLGILAYALYLFFFSKNSESNTPSNVLDT